MVSRCCKWSDHSGGSMDRTGVQNSVGCRGWLYLGRVGWGRLESDRGRVSLFVTLSGQSIRARPCCTVAVTCGPAPLGTGTDMSSTYAECTSPCDRKKRRGISTTRTNKKQDLGRPCSTVCIVSNCESGEPRMNVAIRSSSCSGIPIRSKTSRITCFGGLSKAWYMWKAKMPSQGTSLSMSFRSFCVAWAAETL